MLATVCATACTALLGVDFDGTLEGSTDGAAPDGSAGSCVLAGWPQRPAEEDQVDDGTLELVFALSTLDVGVTDAGTQTTRGFDLDGVCTCPSADSCGRPPDAGTACDADGGVDERGTELIATLAAIGRYRTDATEDLRKGKRSFLLRLVGYNGRADDRKVELSVFSSEGTELDDAGSRLTPRRDGSDRWTVSRSSLIGGNVGARGPYLPNFVDLDAYVADGWLVSRLVFPVLMGDLDMVMLPTEAVTVARIVPTTPGMFRLDDGRTVGRWPVEAVLEEISVIPDPLLADGGGICGASPLYAGIKERICASRDIARDPRNDRTAAACDALATTVVFSAEAAQLGTIVAPSPPVRRCGVAWSDVCAN